MTSDPADLTAADYLDSAREMTAADRPYLAHLLAEEAAQRTPSPAAAAIRATFPDPTTTRKD
ncbi:hypothetical protein GCM10010269_82020 [Streptomyces humidus]|uniref:Uncharacterized protein n=1 Tax=Streptomyces humidus TaxID=52259 RepID=A0A918GEK2_9ACTN|nr:hypothetical protein [Streptomyces humidus]GGS31011.1 hypothetical protein GCM10010269_82020 [Streptomyces humidus]